MAGHRLWNMTRPTRRLATIIEAMPILKKVAEGKEWNRERQREFENELSGAGVKTDGDVREDSGGNRTWAVLPKIFGLWYEDGGKVILTQAAEKIIAGGEEAVTQLRHQVLRFQWPNRTQEHESQKMDKSFKIFPYRFIIKLLLDPRIEYLLTNEIALFVIQTRTEDEFEGVVANILRFRKMREKDSKSLRERNELIAAHKKFRPEKESDLNYSVANHWKYITDFANTFMNHLEFFKEMIHEKSEKFSPEKQISVDPKEKDFVMRMIRYYDGRFPLSSLGSHDDAKWFVENYGNRYDRTKASRKTSKPKTKTGKDKELVKNSLEKILQENISISGKEIVLEISKFTGIREEEIKKIISSNPRDFDFYRTRDPFAEKYLLIAPDGNRHEEFEEMTRKIFDSFGFPTEKLTMNTGTGNKLTIDGFVQNNSKSGIIDAKSGKKFSCGNKEVGIMKDYVKNCRGYKHKGKQFTLEFFAYVYGKKFENISNFNRIRKEAGISGAIISAHEILKLKDAFDKKEISKEKIWNLFQTNKEITSYDY